MALTIVTYLWGDKYGPRDVAKLQAGVKRNLKQEHRFVVISDQPLSLDGCENYELPLSDRYLTAMRGCFARLRLFDPSWQKRISAGERIACMDLDSVVTGDLDVLFNRAENFLILRGANAVNPCPYNGSIWMLRAGYRPDIWTEFSLREARDLPFDEFPDDQWWFAHKIKDVVGWIAGARSGIYAFQKPGWPKGTELPADARLVVFPGWRSPQQFKNLPWVAENWC